MCSDAGIVSLFVETFTPLELVALRAFFHMHVKDKQCGWNFDIKIRKDKKHSSRVIHCKTCGKKLDITDYGACGNGRG